MIISQKAMALATVVGMIGRVAGPEIRTTTYEAAGTCRGGKPMWLNAISIVEFACFSFGNHSDKPAPDPVSGASIASLRTVTGTVTGKNCDRLKPHCDRSARNRGPAPIIGHSKL
jgi:hypothetical protein